MTARIWNSGPPPHIGWWNASCCEIRTTWRWWNGVAWSYPCSKLNSRALAVAQARLKEPVSDNILWTDYYPKNARVPRISP